MAYLGKTPSQAVRSRFYYTATGSETSLSGADDNNNTLIFTDGNYVDVYLNGVLLVSDTDYNTTTANTISGLAALAANDIVEIVVYDTFSVFGGQVSGDFNIVNGTLTADFEGTFTFQAKNTSGAGIAKGAPVYIKGHSGNNAEIGLADADDPTKMPSFGIAAEAIGNNVVGKVVSYGNLRQIDTSAFAVGDELYVSNTGTLTATRPTGTSDAVQKVAKVIRSHASVGQLFVMGAGRTNDIPNSTSNHILFEDNARAIFGTGSDLQIYHDGSASYIKDVGTGQLNISGSAAVNVQDTSGNNMLRGVEGAQAALFYAGSQKMQTTSGGIDVTGTVTADGLTVDTNTLYVDSTNNRVGIGTTSPTSYHTGTRMAVYNSGDSGITIASGTANAGRLHFADGTTGNEQYRGYIVYVHSDDSMQFATSGNEKMRITSGGSVGIGTTSPSYPLEVHGSSGQLIYAQATSGDANIRVDSSNAGSSSYFWARATNTGDSAVQFGDPDDADVGRITYDHSDDSLAFRVNADEKMRIDSSGNVGIGTTSPLGKFMVKDGASSPSALVVRQTSEAGAAALSLDSIFNNTNNTDKEIASIKLGVVTNGSASPNADIRFETVGAGTLSERMRIDSSGNLLVGTTDSSPWDNSANSSADNGIAVRGSIGLLSASRYNSDPLALNRTGSNGTIASFYRSGTVVGGISVATTGTTYNTTSDIRLKTDIAPIADATDKLMAMNAVSHKWKAEPDADAVHGFIAQEMAEIVPEAVSKGDGEDDMWSMDYGRITPVLVAALQDAHKKIQQLEQRIADMEAK